MRAAGVDGPGNTISEALDAASGGLLFAALVAMVGAAVGLAGWAAATYTTAAILLGCAVVSAIVGAAVWGVLHWGVDDTAGVQPNPALRPESDVTFRHAA